LISPTAHSTRPPAASGTRTSTPTSSTRLRSCAADWNHPLPDGNKRASWAALILFIDLNEGAWDPDPPDVDQAEEAVMAVASRQVDEAWFADWLRERVSFERIA